MSGYQSPTEDEIVATEGAGEARDAATERKQFEQWYVENAFDYVRNPIGCRDCGMQWEAWQARAALDALPANAPTHPSPDPLASVREAAEARETALDRMVAHAESLGLYGAEKVGLCEPPTARQA